MTEEEMYHTLFSPELAEMLNCPASEVLRNLISSSSKEERRRYLLRNGNVVETVPDVIRWSDLSIVSVNETLWHVYKIGNSVSFHRVEVTLNYDRYERKFAKRHSASKEENNELYEKISKVVDRPEITEPTALSEALQSQLRDPETQAFTKQKLAAEDITLSYTDSSSEDDYLPVLTLHLNGKYYQFRKQVLNKFDDWCMKVEHHIMTFLDFKILSEGTVYSVPPKDGETASI